MISHDNVSRHESLLLAQIRTGKVGLRAAMFFWGREEGGGGGGGGADSGVSGYATVSCREP